MIMDAVRIVISELFLPQYVEFEAARAGAFVPIELSVSSVFQFLVFARMLRPSRPMIRPFISSLGRTTTETVLSAT